MDTELYKKIGDNIRQARTDKNLTQEKLAQKVGLTASSISNIELGIQRIQLHDLYKIADTLEKEIDQLLPSSREIKDALPSINKTIKDLSSKEKAFVESLRAKMHTEEER